MPRLVSDLESPALLIDLRRLERNLDRQQRRAEEQGVALRPHAKTHKSVAVAREQRERGVRGLTVAKSSEAAVFVDAGFDDVRIAYPVVGEAAWWRILGLMQRSARVSFCVDTEDGVRAASNFFTGEDALAEVLVEIDTGHGRTGVPWDDPRLSAFVRLVNELPGLDFRGILTHGGHSYHGPKDGATIEDARRSVMAQERDRMLDVATRCRQDGLWEEGLEISIGSTPTMSVFENRSVDGLTITEIRPGNYVFHDAQQVALGSAALDDCALTVLATVVSARRDGDGTTRLYLDAGKKVLTSDTGYCVSGHGILLYDPIRMTALPHATITGLSEEHAWVRVPGASTLEVGDRVRIVPNHACVTVATADEVHVVDGEEVVALWSVDARGKTW